MKSLKILSVSLLLVAGFGSCTKKVIEKRIVGTWNVTEVALTANVSGIPSTDVDNAPTGTVTFNKDNSGSQYFSFVFLGQNEIQNKNFSWEATDDIITTDGDNEWKRLMNEENKQRITYTTVESSTETRTYTLTLEK